MDIIRTKRIIYLSAGVVAIMLVIYLGYRSISSPETPTEQQTPRVTGRVPLPSIPELTTEEIAEEIKRPQIAGEPEAVLMALADFPVVSLALNPAGNKVLFYKKDGGGLFVVDFNGKNQEKISNLTVVGLIDALWTRAGDRASVFYLDQEILKSFVQIGTSSVTALPQDLKSFSWSPDGKSLAYLVKKNNELSLVIADSAGRNPRTVYTTPIADAQLSWITSDRIAFQTAPSGLAEGFLFVFSRSNGILSRILGPVFGLTSFWSPDGSQVLTASTEANGRNLKMIIYDASGKAVFSITPPTLPEKCFWASTTLLYCAVPQNNLANTVWPDDYLRGELNTSDRILLIDIKEKKVGEIYNSDFDISDLRVTKNQDYLFFIDRKNGTPWSLKLK